MKDTPMSCSVVDGIRIKYAIKAKYTPKIKRLGTVMKWDVLELAGLVVLTSALMMALTGGSEAGDAISFTDQKGREIALQKPAERVVTIPIPAASMLMAMDGSSQKLVGMHPRSKSALEEGILKTIFPESLHIRSDVVGSGFMPNIEQLLAVDPDLVFQWAHRGDDIIKPITNAGLTVATFLYGTEEYAQEWIRIMGMVLGRQEKADELIRWRHEVKAEIEEVVSAIPDAEKPRVAYFLRFLSSFRIAGTGTYNDFYIRLAGGRNVGADLKNFKDVNAEQIIAWDPEVILLNGFEGELSTEDVYAHPLLADVTAVKNKRVYKVPLGGYRWDPPNQESPLMWKWLTMVLHPERFEWSLREEMIEKYRFIYGHELTDGEIDGILRMQMNGAAAHYQRFTKS